ncbi:hypothetical protein F5Y16DRAFT_387864 [Xylariaceae sp. FL0255]|nr:hypothetical protein F5Y16DRAFT_387864 [Xylariaceae sp. FL0255]
MATAGKDNRVRFFETLDAVPGPMSELLETYSGIPKDEQIAHTVKVRNAAYAIRNFPCIGTFRFLDLDLSFHNLYKEHVLAPLCASAKPGEPEPLFLDVGTCIGQDIRKLVVDGAPAERLWGADLYPLFIDTGFAFFKDENRLSRDRFVAPANMLLTREDPPDALTVLDNKVTIIGITAVFHLFDWADQMLIADRCMRLLRKDTGAPVLLIGAQVGSEEDGSCKRRDDKFRYQHNGESWERFWREVCAQPEWSSKVAKVETESALYMRLRNEERENDDSSRLRQIFADTQGGLAPRWQQFAVWVTFK